MDVRGLIHQKIKMIL